MFWTRTKDVFTMSGEHIAGMLRLSGRKPCRGFLFWCQGKAEREGGEKEGSETREEKKGEATLTMTMPANYFDPVSLSTFLSCLLFERKWRTVQC